MTVPAVARRLGLSAAAISLLLASPIAAGAQARKSVRIARTPVAFDGYLMFGLIKFTAVESFEAIVGEASGPILGGGVRVAPGFGGLFVDVGAWHYSGQGERAFVFDDEVFRLGIPVDVRMTPIEISAGWRLRLRKLPKVTPYAAGGLTVMRYAESSDLSGPSEDFDDSFTGYHILGGAEYDITRWLGVAGEASWSTIPDAIGTAGVSKAFNENNLGGTTVRLKITIGR